jgi:uncharacterized protein (TIGR00730 family)
MADKHKVISVFGSSAPRPGSADYEAARRVGRLLAEAGFTVQTGAYSGVMAGASQGANEAGGHVIGITSAQIEQFRPIPPNPWVIEEIKYKTLQERQAHVVIHCDGAVVMPGGIGTLAELSMMWSLVQVGEVSPRPIVTVGGLWQRTLAAFFDEAYLKPAHQQLLTVVRTPDEAVKEIVTFFAE